MTPPRPPREHHFVPRGLLRPWAREIAKDQIKLTGYYWDKRQNRLRYKQRGVGGFCFQIELLSFRHRSNQPSELETKFFQTIDNLGLKARDAMIANGPESLSGDQRCDFARLLLSLETRRPTNIKKLRDDVASSYRHDLNTDNEILEVMEAEGVEQTPAEFLEAVSGWSMEDRALLLTQRLVDNRKIGEQVINMTWRLRRLRREHGSLMLSDRPLIRIHGLQRPGSTWVLPLTPKIAFIAANHADSARLLARLSARKFVEQTNISSMSQAERFVFSVDRSQEREIGPVLRSRARAS
jgi:hypothetical protein